MEFCTRYSGTWKRLVREIREGFTVEMMFQQNCERKPDKQEIENILGIYVVHFRPTPDFWT